MKMLELSDAISTFQNGMQTFTPTIVREGFINNTGIKLEYLDPLGEAVFVTCTVDGLKTFILMTADKRLPFGDTRQTIKDNGLEFLYQNCDSEYTGKWEYSFDLNDDENSTKYQIKNTFFEEYKENPLRNGLKFNELHAKFILYFPVEGKTENVDGLAMLEVGNDLFDNSGLVHYYNFRLILETDVSYL